MVHCLAVYGQGRRAVNLVGGGVKQNALTLDVLPCPTDAVYTYLSVGAKNFWLQHVGKRAQ